MRKNVGRGVGHLDAKLPRGVRSVLARGLDPDATKRWPAMEELLDALEHQAKAPARRRQLWAYSLSFVILIVALVLKFATGDDDGAKTACDDPERQFAEAWSPTIRA